MTVPVRVGDRGPYRFLVDTGSERTAISRELALELGLAAGSRVVMQSVVGPSNVSTVAIPALGVSTRLVAIPNAPILDEENIGADGLLGVDSLSRQQVMLDFKNGVMGISPSRGFLDKSDGDTIVVTAKRRHGRLLFTDATVEGRGVTVVVDTGSQVSVGNDALRRKLLRGKHYQLSEITTVAGERVEAELVTIGTLQIGGMTLQNVQIAFLHAAVFRQLELDNRPALLLGMNVMRSFDRVSIDFSTRQVRFVLPKSAMEPRVILASR
ncbi:MAG: aspartyl protease family protein [Sphingomicrobium sp.]